MADRFGVDNLVVSYKMGFERTITFPGSYSHSGKVHRFRIHQDEGKLPIFSIDTTHADLNISGQDVSIDLSATSTGDEGKNYGDILPGKYFYAFDFDYNSTTDDSDNRIQGKYDIVDAEGDAKLDQSVGTLDLGDITVNITFSQPTPVHEAVTLAAAATTFDVVSSEGRNDSMTITGDAGANTIATITGGVAGQHVTLLFVDGLVTITDTAAHTANTVDLSAAFTSADDTVLQLFFDGTSWYEVSRSTN